MNNHLTLENTTPNDYLVDVEVCYAGCTFHHSYMTRAITDSEAHESATMYTQSHYQKQIDSLRAAHPDFNLKVSACYQLDYQKRKNLLHVVPMFVPGKYLGKRV